MTQDVSPTQAVSEEIYRDFLKTFQSFQDPAALMHSPLMARPLVQRALGEVTDQLPHVVLKTILLEVLTLLAAENPLYVDLLRGRFWEGLQIEEMLQAERPQVMGKRTFSNYQRSAIQAFAFLFLQTEAGGYAAPAPESGEEVTPATVVTTSAALPPLPRAAPHEAPPQQTASTALKIMPTVPWRWLAGMGALGLVAIVLLILWARTDTTTATLLFADDFEEGATKWRTNSDAWSIRQEADGNHSYCVETTGEYTYALTGSTTWRDYAWELDLKIVESAPQGSGNLLWRVGDDFYPFYLLDFFAESVGGAVLAKEVPDYTTLDQTLRPLPEGVWIHLRITVTGDEMALYYGQEPTPLLTARDVESVAHGAIGMGAGFPAGDHEGRWIICFDNVTVYAGT